ncbi:hypothetical protein HWV62_15397 [Athelia sp. TMB]|nr:hypothetical protein HWV62_34325 [Athelia sp. TMB]KAF7984364.1 hypothetical protein HWV62_15397 [Athelia sp. TMB]
MISFAVFYSAMDSSTVPSNTPALSYAPEDGAIVLHSSSSSSSGHSPSESVDEKETPPPSVKEIEFKVDPEALPPKTGTTATRYLKHNFFSAYRRIFATIFFANLATLIALCVVNKGAPSAAQVGAAASANLMLTSLFRQEEFVNILYEIAVACPLSFPLAIRRRLATVFHYGGAHSGFGTAAVTWYLLYTALATKDFVQTHNRNQIPNIVTSYILVLMFCFILGAAHPKFRVRYHDHFEMMHRYSGWVAMVTFWVHIVTASRVYAEMEGTTTGLYMVKSSNFWTFLVSTCCLILSWSRLRCRKVYPEILSDHAIRLHFKYTDMAPFYGVKISSSPVKEWHAFATIPDVDEATGKRKGFSVVVSNAGDWTKETITNPPTQLWVRGAPLHGLLFTSKLFRRIVVVATGSGIGPCLSLLHADYTPRRVLWSTPHPETTYGPKILNAVLKADPKAVVWNTRTQGRPDMVALTYALVLESQAEAVFIISNPKVTRKVVYGMNSRGIAAFGAIFDS